MGSTLSVKEGYVWVVAELLKGFQNCWALPKSQQAGDIRESHWDGCPRNLNEFQLGKSQNANNRLHLVVANWWTSAPAMYRTVSGNSSSSMTFADNSH
jgi:hypothetical protein